MDKNGSAIVLLLLFMIAFGQSNAFNSRKLATSLDPNGSSNANQDSSSSSPPPDEKKPNLSPDDSTKPNDAPAKSPSNMEPKALSDANTQKSSEISGDKKLDKGKNEYVKEQVDSKSCKGNQICSDQEKTMIACIQEFENGSNNLTLLVQNEGDVDLKGNINVGTYLQAFNISGHETKKVNVNMTFSGDKSTKVILNAGNGDCELQISRPKTTPNDNPSKSKDPENTTDPKDVNSPADSPAKPKDKDDPSKAKKADNSSKPEHVDAPTKSPKDIDPLKSKDVKDSSESKDVDDPTKSKSKDVDDKSKSKDVDNPSKSKEVDDPTNSKSKEVDDPTKSKGTDTPPKPTTSVDTDTPISQNNLLDQLSFYSKQVTPMYGAYLAFLVALVIGGSWALCSFRKRRTDNGVPYQELEMGLPSSSSTVHVETAEGWDQDWDDDDWDEDKAIRSPGGRAQPKTISSNGLTSRATKTDGWDADWDD